MKRVLALLAALLLFVLPCAQAFAAMPPQAEAPVRLPVWEEDAPAPAGDGQLSVVIQPGLWLQKDTTFTVTLSGQGGKAVMLPANIQAQQSADTDVIAPKTAVDFTGLAAGSYDLTITAPGFATHTQQVQVDDGVRLEFYTGLVNGYTYKTDSIHPGALLAGDVNGDGQIGAADKAALADLLDAQYHSAGADSPEVANARAAAPYADLNGDGRTDLVDMEYLALALQTADTAAAAVSVLPVDRLQLPAVEGTTLGGGVQNLLAGEQPLTLTPANGGAISADNPVTLDVELSAAAAMEGLVVRTPAGRTITGGALALTYLDEEGHEQTLEGLPIDDAVNYLLKSEQVRIERGAEGALVVHFGAQIAIKKVTITITALQKQNSTLAAISTVEFLNDMESRIPAPELDIPQKLLAAAGNKQFTLSWEACVNVTGYEVSVADANGTVETFAVRTNTLQVTSLGQGRSKLKNYDTYTARVCATNGSWRSGFSDPVQVTPMPDKRPDRPDNLRAEGAYQSIQLSWKKMEDTLTYNVYYRQQGATEYTKVADLAANSHTLTGLGDRVTYEVYVTGVNELGESDPSLTAKATTTDIDPAHLPQFGLVNKTPAGSEGSALTAVTFQQGGMVDSALDTGAGSALGTADKDASSYYSLNTWDSGGYNTMGAQHGLTYQFDKAYTMQEFAFQEPVLQSTAYGYARVGWTDENGKETIENASIQRRNDAEGRSYYWVRLPRPVTTDRLRIALARRVASGSITISEIHFYHYNSLMDEILALYTDDLHTVLRQDVTQQTIDALRERINTPDESGELHPDRAMLERELKTAEEILQLGAALAQPVQVHSGITTNDVGRGFGGLNAWQPLGVTAAAGEQIVLYVGHNAKKTGDGTNLQLVATQYHAEAAAVSQTVANLKVGRNEITLPKLSSTACEAGGALYIQYTGSNADDRYAVRVNGGAQVPVLDLYGVTDTTQRLALAESYITALDSYVEGQQALHETLHAAQQAPTAVRYDYDAQNCILGASDILLDTMLLSLPAQQVLAGLGEGTAAQRAEKLTASLDAMGGMMDLFYQHKGLNRAATDAVDQYPKAHLNIRYQRMFSGAFMYASGNHIGIEWGSVGGMVTASPVAADAEGRYQSGRYFGWGIAHEIGHCINQGAYAVAEITNNYFAVLAQAKDTNDSVRFQYRNVYDKVTSGTKGRASNVFTQLGLYWQLHLAYDNGYNYKTYAAHAEQLQNLFFARVDSYARTPANAPKPGGVALNLSGGTDQALMRLACAAAQKNLLDFFGRWGMTPDEETLAYAGQFAPETRAIYYANDEARVYRLTHEGSSLNADGTTPAVADTTSATVDAAAPNRVKLTLASTLPADQLLGYEVVRCTTAGGQVEKAVVGFSTDGSFTDTITTMNNRTVFYEVTVIDQYLNRSAVKTLEPLKIQHDGAVDKAGFTATTANLTAIQDPASTPATEEDPCAPQAVPAIQWVLDNDTDTVYTGTTESDAAITLEFGRTLSIEGLRLDIGEEGAFGAYTVRVRDAQGNWADAASGSLTAAGVQTVYFARGGNVASYAATALQLVIPANGVQTIVLREMDVLGVTGDNVEFRHAADGQPAVGRLTEDYVLDADAGSIIPAGSIVFTGSYKGNPAYNVVLLYDQQGRIVGGMNEDNTLKAYQAILAEQPPEGDIRNVADGSWVYWIEPQDLAGLAGVSKVRAELYRVDNAQTNEGQRLVSDSLFETLPENLDDLPAITLQGGAQG